MLGKCNAKVSKKVKQYLNYLCSCHTLISRVKLWSSLGDKTKNYLQHQIFAKEIRRETFRTCNCYLSNGSNLSTFYT